MTGVVEPASIAAASGWNQPSEPGAKRWLLEAATASAGLVRVRVHVRVHVGGEASLSVILLLSFPSSCLLLIHLPPPLPYLGSSVRP